MISEGQKLPFSVSLILREIKIGKSQCGNLVIFLLLTFYVKSYLSNFRRSKPAHLTNLEALIFGKFHTWRCQKFPKIQNSELQKKVKMAVLGLQNDICNWFHEKSVAGKLQNLHTATSESWKLQIRQKGIRNFVSHNLREIEFGKFIATSLQIKPI